MRLLKGRLQREFLINFINLLQKYRQYTAERLFTSAVLVGNKEASIWELQIDHMMQTEKMSHTFSSGTSGISRALFLFLLFIYNEVTYLTQSNDGYLVLNNVNFLVLHPSLSYRNKQELFSCILHLNYSRIYFPVYCFLYTRAKFLYNK